MNEHPRWAQQVKDLLDESAQNLDAATLSRLNHARQRAMGERRSAPRWIIPAGLASACALLLAVAVLHGHPGALHSHSDVGTPTSHDSPVGDTEASADDDDFYEDLDFYVWLDAQDQDPEG